MSQAHSDEAGDQASLNKSLSARKSELEWGSKPICVGTSAHISADLAFHKIWDKYFFRNRGTWNIDEIRRLKLIREYLRSLVSEGSETQFAVCTKLEISRCQLSTWIKCLIKLELPNLVGEHDRFLDYVLERLGLSHVQNELLNLRSEAFQFESAAQTFRAIWQKNMLPPDANEMGDEVRERRLSLIATYVQCMHGDPLHRRVMFRSFKQNELVLALDVVRERHCVQSLIILEYANLVSNFLQPRRLHPEFSMKCNREYLELYIIAVVDHWELRSWVISLEKDMALQGEHSAALQYELQQDKAVKDAWTRALLDSQKPHAAQLGATKRLKLLKKLSGTIDLQSVQRKVIGLLKEASWNPDGTRIDTEESFSKPVSKTNLPGSLQDSQLGKHWASASETESATKRLEPLRQPSSENLEESKSKLEIGNPMMPFQGRSRALNHRRKGRIRIQHVARWKFLPEANALRSTRTPVIWEGSEYIAQPMREHLRASRKRTDSYEPIPPRFLRARSRATTKEWITPSTGGRDGGEEPKDENKSASKRPLQPQMADGASAA